MRIATDRVAAEISCGARELINRILRARLCTCFGAAIEDLRALDIRTITDLDGVRDAEPDELSKQTPLTLNRLHKATRGPVSEQNIDCPKRAADPLSD